MAVVPLTCPRCAGLIQLDIAQAGRQVPCPACQGLISVPPIELLCPPPAAPPVVGAPVEPQAVEPPPVELIQLTCSACQGCFQVATTLAGSRVACPHCNQLVMAPPRTAAEPAPPLLPGNQSATLPAAPPAAVEPPAAELSPKQCARRRHTRNLILWIVCLAILVVVVWLLR